MFTLTRPSLILLALLAGGAVLSLPVQAEKADRNKPLILESDQPCTVNLLKQTSVCSGNVVISQGTLQIRADKLELRESPEGYQLAQASGVDSKPATYRQKRDGVDEFVEGQAQRIDYDSRSGTLRFEGQAQVRRLRSAALADQIQGAVIVWDSVAEVFNVRGGAVSPDNPGGRVRAVIAPRGVNEAAAAASSGLRPSPTLGDRR